MTDKIINTIFHDTHQGQSFGVASHGKVSQSYNRSPGKGGGY